jgi:hypothetical protein
MFVAQSAARYTNLCYLREISHFLQDLFPFIRDAFVQYEPCELFADICEVLCREFHVAERKHVIGRVCILVIGRIGFVGLLIDGLHININDYNGINVTTNKVFVQTENKCLSFFTSLNNFNVQLIRYLYMTQFLAFSFIFSGNLYITALP